MKLWPRIGNDGLDVLVQTLPADVAGTAPQGRKAAGRKELPVEADHTLRRCPLVDGPNIAEGIADHPARATAENL
eukprot:scaffold2771_cov252-Pinguiococcus_pyrenoidosus.AAC.14